MGSWNGTCALTNLPLGQGTPVVAYVLHLTNSNFSIPGGGFIHATDMAHPVGPALRGEYNGYGGVGNLHGPALAWWRTRLVELEPELMTAEAEALDAEMTGSLEAWLNDGIAEGTVFQGLASKRDDADYEPDTQFGLMLVHADAHACFMARAQAPDDWMLDDGCANPVALYLGKLRDVEASMAAVAKAESKGKPKGDALIRLRSTVFRAFDTLRAFRYHNEPVLASVFQFAKEQNDEALLTEVANTYIFDMALEIARKSWNRQCGAGSGNDDFGLQLVLAQFVVDRAAE